MIYRYLSFVYEQKPAADGAPRFCIFYAKAGEILKWATIQRLSKTSPNAIQRAPKRTRILGIKRFLEQDPRNTIPTAVVIALNGANIRKLATCTLDGGSALIADLQNKIPVQLEITVPDGTEETKLPGLVIDGQHRLSGVEAYNPDTLLNVVAILDASEVEQAFQFLVINNKSAKVPPDHIRAMVTIDPEEGELKDRLRTARLNLDENVGSVAIMDSDTESPFYGLIKWPHNMSFDNNVNAVHEGYVAPAAIESAIGYIRTRQITDLDDRESAEDFFLCVWSTIKTEWASIFNKDSKLLDKVGIICLTEFLTRELRSTSLHRNSQFSMANPEKVIENTKYLLERLEPDFWQVEWKSTSYDTRAGRDQIVAALDRIYGNKADGIPWFRGVDIIKESDAITPNS